MAEACVARPPVKPSDLPTMTKRQRKDWHERGNGQMGNVSEEVARMAAGGAAEDGPGAPLATTQGPAAEVLYEGAKSATWTWGTRQRLRGRRRRRG